jgi:hypothetical protein
MLDFNIRGTSRNIDRKPIPSNSFLDSLQYPDIDRDSFNPEDVFLLPEDVNNLKKPRNIKNSITSTPPMAQSKMPTMTPPSMPTPRPSMPMNMPSMEEPEPEQDSTNFLGSLLAQGTAMLGAGIQGGDVGQVGRSFEYGRQRAEQDRKAKALIDPKSEESKRRRMVFEKALDFKIPEEYSATDLNDPVVLQSIRDKKMQEMAPKGGVGIGGLRGGVAQAKPEKEKKSNEKLLDDYTKHAQSLQSSIDVIQAINKLKRTRLGKYTPDFSTDTQAEAGTVDRAGAGLVKVLAGAGTVSDSDFDRLKLLVPNSNMNKDLAYRTAQNQTLEGTNKALAGLRIDRDLGRINETDFKKIISQYNRYLKDPRLELNKFIDEQGELVDSTPPSEVEFSKEE